MEQLGSVFVVFPELWAEFASSGGAQLRAGYVGSDGTVRVQFRANQWRLFVLPATSGRKYPIVDFRFVLIHPEVCNDDLCRGSVELRRYVRFVPLTDIGPYARVPWGGNAIWECRCSSSTPL